MYNAIKRLEDIPMFAGTKVSYIDGIPHIDLETLAELGQNAAKRNRLYMFFLESAVLKSGHNTGMYMLGRSHGWNSTDSLQERTESIYSEFRNAIRNSDLGLPVVRPAAIVRAEGEYMMLEPRGESSERLLSSEKSTQKMYKMIRAWGGLFADLRRLDHAYDHDPSSLFEHALAFRRDEEMEILLTDNPHFNRPNDNLQEGSYCMCIRQWLEKEAAGNQDMKHMIHKAFRQGYQ